MKKHIFTIAIAILALVSCGDGGNGDEWGGDWYNGGIKGDYATFTIDFTSSTDWDISARRHNASIKEEWLTFSPTKGNAGDNTVTFRVSKNENLLDYYVVHIDMPNSDFDLYLSSEENESSIEFYADYSSITNWDISQWTQLDYLNDVGQVINNLTVWMKQGQTTTIFGNPTWEIKYK